MEFPTESRKNINNISDQPSPPLSNIKSVDVSEQYAQEQLLSSIASVQSAKQLLREDTDPLDLLERDEMKRIISMVKGRRQKGYSLGGGCGNNHSNLLSSSSFTNIPQSQSMLSMGIAQTNESFLTVNSCATAATTNTTTTAAAAPDQDNHLVDKLLISNENFSPKSFLLQFHRHTSYSSLVQGIDRLKRATTLHDLNMHALVRDNFDRFIRAKNATESLASKLKKDNLTSSGMAKEILLLRKGYQVTNDTFSCLLSQREREVELRSKLELFRKWSPILRLGDCLERSIALGEYNEAIKAYEEAKAAMENVSHFEEDDESLSLMQQLWSGHIDSSLNLLRSNLISKLQCPIYDWKTYLSICEILHSLDQYPSSINSFIDFRFNSVKQDLKLTSIKDSYWSGNWFRKIISILNDQLMSNFVPIFNHILLGRSSIIKDFDISNFEALFIEISNCLNFIFDDMRDIPISFDSLILFLKQVLQPQRDQLVTSKYFIILSTQTHLKVLYSYLVDGIFCNIFNGISRRILSIVWNYAICRFGEVSLNSKEYINDYEKMLLIVSFLNNFLKTSPFNDFPSPNVDDEMDGKKSIIDFIEKTSSLYDPALKDRYEYSKALLIFIREFHVIIKYLDAFERLSPSLERFVKRYCEIEMTSITLLLESGIAFNSYDLSLGFEDGINDEEDVTFIMMEPSPWIVSLLDKVKTIKRDIDLIFNNDNDGSEMIFKTLVLQIKEYWLHLIESFSNIKIGKIGTFILVMDLSIVSYYLNDFVDDFYTEIENGIYDLYNDAEISTNLRKEIDPMIQKLSKKWSSEMEIIFKFDNNK